MLICWFLTAYGVVIRFIVHRWHSLMCFYNCNSTVNEKHINSYNRCSYMTNTFSLHNNFSRISFSSTVCLRISFAELVQTSAVLRKKCHSWEINLSYYTPTHFEILCRISTHITYNSTVKCMHDITKQWRTVILPICEVCSKQFSLTRISQSHFTDFWSVFYISLTADKFPTFQDYTHKWLPRSYCFCNQMFAVNMCISRASNAIFTIWVESQYN